MTFSGESKHEEYVNASRGIAARNNAWATHDKVAAVVRVERAPGHITMSGACWPV